MPGQIDEEVKEWRANTLMEIQRSVANDSSGKYIGQILDVLVERYDGRSDVFIGRSQYDAPEIDGEVYVSNCSAAIGEIKKVRITHAYEYDLSGEGVL
ncbi:Ribosomal protein S12 methylthiotransferase RimO [compost metagenome]